MDNVLSNNKVEFDNYLGKMYQIDDTNESSTSSSPVDREGRTINFTFPFTTNVMVSISI